MPFLEHYITLQIILKNIKLLMLLVKIQFFGRQYQKACKKQFVSFCLNIDINFDFFFYNYQVLHKTLSLPYVRPSATRLGTSGPRRRLHTTNYKTNNA